MTITRNGIEFEITNGAKMIVDGQRDYTTDRDTIAARRPGGQWGICCTTPANDADAAERIIDVWSTTFASLIV